ncbi:MFS transporter [Bacillus cereus]|uniref:MFS transporter n=1 Tax=Bacillus cereus TaxID=1396 RepID=UPI00027C0538|nr:MFS transporter [Bacillus cereus]EJV57023.1 hypothetical protein IEM_05074 [Bacillus cereus BAG6O-2]
MQQSENVKKVMPMIMVIFLSSATLIQAFTIISPQLAIDFNLPESTISMQASIAMLVLGVASIIYSTLSDSISIRKLIIFGVLIMCIGSVLGFVFSNSFIMVVISRAIQTFGGTGASALLIITASRYLDEKTQVEYYGYNTACAQASMALGVLCGGFLSTYVSWKVLFLLPLISVITIPALLKYLPEDSKRTNQKLDVAGISLISIITILLSLYFNDLDIKLLLLSIASIVVFTLYIMKKKNAFITVDFFQNKKYLLTIVLVFLTFGVQAAFSFVFAFLAQNIHQVNLGTVSLIMLPSFVVGTVIGIVSGKITIKFGLSKTIMIAISLMGASLLIGSIFIDTNITVLALVTCMFSGAMGLLYAPFMTIVINALPKEKVGAGLGFFNLMISVASSMGIAITGKLLSVNILQNINLFGLETLSAPLFSNILLIYVVVLIIGLGLYWLNKSTLSIKENA